MTVKDLLDVIRNGDPGTGIGSFTPSPTTVAQSIVRNIRDGDGGSYSIGDENLLDINNTTEGSELQEFAVKIFTLMTASGKSQTVLYRGPHSIDKQKALTTHLSHLSLTSAPPSNDIPTQIAALETLLTAFGSSPDASTPGFGADFAVPASPTLAFTKYLELHYTGPRLVGAKVLAFNLDRSRLTTHCRPGQAPFGVFYALVRGATPEERRELQLLDTGAYSLLSAPAGAPADLGALRRAFRVLGFRQRHVSSLMRILSAILLLRNVDFREGVDSDPFASIASEGAPAATAVVDRGPLEAAAELLELPASDLERCFLHSLRWSRKEMTETVLDVEGAIAQRDAFISGLYAVLFAFVVETCNHRMLRAVPARSTIISHLVVPAFTSTSHAPLARTRTMRGALNTNLTLPLNTFEDLLVNVQGDFLGFACAEAQLGRGEVGGVAAARMDLLFGTNTPSATRPPHGLLGQLDAATRQAFNRGTSSASLLELRQELVRGLKETYRAHPAFRGGLSGEDGKSGQARGLAAGTAAATETTGSLTRHTSLIQQQQHRMQQQQQHVTAATAGSYISFGIAHTAGDALYDTQTILPAELDLFDPTFVSVLNTSADKFVAKLLSGPGLAAQLHPLEPSVLVAAQISSCPLRGPHNLVYDPELAEEDFPFDLFKITPRSTQLFAVLAHIISVTQRAQTTWTVTSIAPNTGSGTGHHCELKYIASQLEAYLVPELIGVKSSPNKSYVLRLPLDDFLQRYAVPVEDASSQASLEAARAFLSQFGQEGRDYAFDADNVVHLAFSAVAACERHAGAIVAFAAGAGADREFASFDNPFETNDELFEFTRGTHNKGLSGRSGESGESAPQLIDSSGFGEVPLLSAGANETDSYALRDLGPDSRRQTFAPSEVWFEETTNQHNLNEKSNDASAPLIDDDGNVLNATAIEETPVNRTRRVWMAIVWGLTWIFPNACLKHIGRMKRPDVRTAWREKVALCMLIGFACGIVIFYIVVFGKLLCPNLDKAWNTKELAYHTGSNDLYVAVRGEVYDITKFYHIQHSDISAEPVTSDDMLELGGLDMTNYFPYPLTKACPTLITDETLYMSYANFTAVINYAVHTSGPLQSYTSSELYNIDWYTTNFLPTMKKYRKGPLVYSKKKVRSLADTESRTIVLAHRKVYDLTDYFYTIEQMNNDAYSYLDGNFSAVFSGSPGEDVSDQLDALLTDGTMDADTFATNMDCLTTLFYVGDYDFRDDAICKVQPDLLLAFSIILVATIAIKFLAALQLGSRRFPELRDKFVILQVTCYTEDEESLKRTIDSLATAQYDDTRKLLLVICDGMIVGSGNDKPTPRIVLDIFGVGDDDEDPDPLMFKSIAEGSKQLNYGKVWSGLYEVEGHVVPYLVVAKVGRPSERSKPGNRGKRDSQILAMRFLNRVHFDAPMYPLELEMCHQVKNVIGVDPALYEFLLVVDADTLIAPDALNRLIAQMADDSKIVGLCGETLLDNEKNTWWTMIQVYEYFISHHMSKAFESLFGSVTCLPGCFTMYRLRTADKGKPLLISSDIIEDYSDNTLDTLHKKNLLALGEDRYLTTLIMKHFPKFKTKFTADAQARTVAPDQWAVLLSQRRRWINSTVHNLAELIFLKDMCGFCCFGMRFIVLIDLVGTIILPATFVYLMYLIITVSTGSSPLPIISLVMIAAVYGLQAVIFLLKRQWQYIGWLIIYILAYPVYSFILPVYSFWRFDDFSWGNTRVVIGEGKNKKVISNEEETFDERVIPTRRFAEYEELLKYDSNPYGYDTKSGYDAKSVFSEMTLANPRKSRATLAKSMYSFYDEPPRPTSVNFLPPSQSFSGSLAVPQTYDGGFHPQSSQAPPAFPSTPPAFAAPLGPPPPFAGMPPGMPMMNPFMSMPNIPQPGPMMLVANPNPSPSDGELIFTLKQFLATQDLMQVTKRSTRQHLANLFPNADLGSRKDFINTTIDQILTGKL